VRSASSRSALGSSRSVLGSSCILAGIGFAVAVQDYSCTPHMRQQPFLRAYEMPMPPPPPHTVPRSPIAPVPTAEEARSLRNPIQPTPNALVLGKLYYGYYCLHCHGDDGRGATPVGSSYHPSPTDLSAASVQRQSDGELYRAMVVGTGHAPTLSYIVPPNRRWLIELHVRTLAAPQAPKTSPAGEAAPGTGQPSPSP
jgi:hypothetical protein